MVTTVIQYSLPCRTCNESLCLLAGDAAVVLLSTQKVPCETDQVPERLYAAGIERKCHYPRSKRIAEEQYAC